jgi:hypothetical protein
MQPEVGARLVRVQAGSSSGPEEPVDRDSALVRDTIDDLPRCF